MKKLITLLATATLALSTVAFADDAQTNNPAPAATGTTSDKPVVADLSGEKPETMATPAAGQEAAAAPAAAKKHHHKHGKKHHHHHAKKDAKPADSTSAPADAAKPATDAQPAEQAPQ